MLRKQAGMPVELPSPSANNNHLAHPYCEIVEEIYQTLCQSSLAAFIYSFVDSLYSDLNFLLYDIERLPESEFNTLIEVIGPLRDARNEMRLARFLFDVEEIPPVYRLLMRNRALLRGKTILHKALRVWPLYNSSHE